VKVGSAFRRVVSLSLRDSFTYLLKAKTKVKVSVLAAAEIPSIIAQVC